MQITTHTPTRRAFVLLGVLALLAVAPTAARADRDAELRERFKNRLDDLQSAKSAGKIGETRDGTVDAVEAKHMEDGKLRTLVEEENADRRELYKLIAEKEKTSEAKVAERAGARNFQRARSGEYLKDKDGKWKKKA